MREQRPEKDKVLSFIQELLALAAGYARERGCAGIERYEELFVYSKALNGAAGSNRSGNGFSSHEHADGESADLGNESTHPFTTIHLFVRFWLS